MAAEAAQRPGGDLCNVTPYASKSAEQAARIAAVLTLWAHPGAVTVNAEVMTDAITLAQFHLSEAVRLADGAVISEKSEQAEILRCWLVDSWKDAEIIPGDVRDMVPRHSERQPWRLRY